MKTRASSAGDGVIYLAGGLAVALLAALCLPPGPPAPARAPAVQHHVFPYPSDAYVKRKRAEMMQAAAAAAAEADQQLCPDERKEREHQRSVENSPSF